jgi:hypothetical protein
MPRKKPTPAEDEDNVEILDDMPRMFGMNIGGSGANDEDEDDYPPYPDGMTLTDEQKANFRKAIDIDKELNALRDADDHTTLTLGQQLDKIVAAAKLMETVHKDHDMYLMTLSRNIFRLLAGEGVLKTTTDVFIFKGMVEMEVEECTRPSFGGMLGAMFGGHRH